MYNRIIAKTLSALMLWATLLSGANAAVVTTREAVQLQGHEQRLAEVQAVLSRAEVRQAMVDMGVDPVQASTRVAALSEEELAGLHNNMETAPAGGILALIGAVFLVLLILEVTGVTDIFKKV